MSSHRSLPLPLLSLLLCATTACSEGGGAASAVADPEPQGAGAAAPATGPCRLKVGWEPFPPYQYRNDDGGIEGLDIDLARAALAAAHCESSYVEGRWVTLVRQLQRGDVDVLAGAARTRARESFALFSDAYRNESAVLYVRKGDATVQRSASLQALLETGFRLGVREQYSYGETVDALQENPLYADRFIGATIGEQNYQRLLDLEIDGFLEDRVAAGLVMRKQGLQEEIEAHPLPIYSGEVALMFGKATVAPVIVAEVNVALARLRADGRYQDIVDRYAN
jgi:polar amino acid transport system substrate-binding protein